MSNVKKLVHHISFLQSCAVFELEFSHVHARAHCVTFTYLFAVTRLYKKLFILTNLHNDLKQNNLQWV